MRRSIVNTPLHYLIPCPLPVTSTGDRTVLGQNDFVALFEGYDRLFPVVSLAGLLGALTPGFAVDVHGVHLGDLYLEQFLDGVPEDRKSTRLNSSHVSISYAVFCLKKKTELFGD